MQIAMIPQDRRQIREIIIKDFGGIADYCAQRSLKYTVVMNLLKGFTPHSRHPEIIERINKDTGADMAAWEK